MSAPVREGGTSVATSLADVLPSEALSEDGSGPDVALAASPEAVVRPETTEEVAAALGWASARGVGVLPMASGRRVPQGVGARALDRPFVVLRTDRLKGIEIYEPADLTLTARAGTTLHELGERLGAHRQWLPFDPPRVGERSLGGLVASGESGPSWMGYGELRNHVLGMTIVTGDGRTLKLGGRVVKNVAGFDMLKPLVGSRGRLAVITSVCVRAFPQPAEDRLLVLRADDPSELYAVARAVGTAPVLPVSSVLVAPAPGRAAGAALLVRLHGSRPAVEADQRTLERHCGVTFERPADSDGLLAAARDHASEGPAVLVITVLSSRLGEALSAVADTLGDGGAGAELFADTYLGQIRVAPRALDAAAMRTLRAVVSRLDGTLTVRATTSFAGPVGSGDGEAPTRSPLEHDLVSGLERVFDPTGVLWPCR